MLYFLYHIFVLYFRLIFIENISLVPYHVISYHFMSRNVWKKNILSQNHKVVENEAGRILQKMRTVARTYSLKTTRKRSLKISQHTSGRLLVQALAPLMN